MKKFLVKLLLVVLAVSMIFPLCVALTGCENEDKGDTPPNTDTENSGENDTENGGENNQTGESNKTETPPSTEEKSYGTIKYFSDDDSYSYTVQFSADLTEKQAESLKSMINDIDDWTDDRTVDRFRPFIFNGEFQFADSEYVYRFSYVDTVIFYNYYFSSLSLDRLSVITSVLSELGFAVPKEDIETAESYVDKGNVQIDKGALNGLPNKKFNRDFRIITDYNDHDVWKNSEYGSPVNYAVYMRNKAIEEQYDVKIKQIEVLSRALPDYVDSIYKANDVNGHIDLINCGAMYSGNIVLAGQAMNLFELDHVDFTQPWWDQNSIADLSANGKLFTAVGAMSTSAIRNTYCMFYNKNLLSDNGIPDMYEVITSGKWDYGTMLSYIGTVRKDLNNDGKFDENDLYGLITDTTQSYYAYIWAFDNPIFRSIDEKDTFEWSFMENRLKINAMGSILLSLYHRTDGVYAIRSYYKHPVPMFRAGQAIFINSTIELSSNFDRWNGISEDSWGICPYPKYNNQQNDYISSVHAAHTVIMAPKTFDKDKLEKIGVITEALNRLSYGNNSLIGAVYEEIGGSKYLTDKKEAEVLNLILDSRVYDIGHMFMGSESPAFWIQEIIATGSGDIEEKYNNSKFELEGYIEDAYAAFGLEFEGLQ